MGDIAIFTADLFDASALSGCPSSRLCVRYAKEQSANVSAGEIDMARSARRVENGAELEQN